ncbi:MAG TPA: lytic transglycosylase domain-containing protein [Acetobacteraceae bacterium]|nr:lytic transglycosylase domain-containing protein [Acetobacteraceae bacterium]
MASWRTARVAAIAIVLSCTDTERASAQDALSAADAELAHQINERALIVLDPRQTEAARLVAEARLDAARAARRKAKLEAELAMKIAEREARFPARARAVIPAALLACGANVSPVTLEAMVRIESAGNPLALHVNGLPVQPAPAASAQEAARIAQAYIRRGFNVDLGLMQVNSRNLAELGLTVEQALEPCTSVRAGAMILTANYTEAVRRHGEGQAALKAALSAYNTGDFYRGFANGYLGRYYAAGSVSAP